MEWNEVTIVYIYIVPVANMLWNHLWLVQLCKLRLCRSLPNTPHISPFRIFSSGWLVVIVSITTTMQCTREQGKVMWESVFYFFSICVHVRKLHISRREICIHTCALFHGSWFSMSLRHSGSVAHRGRSTPAGVTPT